MKPDTLAGIPIRVATDAEGVEADFVVCGPTSHFPDDVHATCGCGASIVHRPDVPIQPPKICVACFKAMIGPKH